MIFFVTLEKVIASGEYQTIATGRSGWGVISQGLTSFLHKDKAIQRRA